MNTALAALLFVVVADSPARSDVLAWVGFDERHSASLAEVQALAVAVGAEVVFHQLPRTAVISSPEALLLLTSEEEFSLLASARALFPYPVSYFNLKFVELEGLGHPCLAWEESVEILNCQLQAVVEVEATADVAEAWALVRSLGGINPGGEPVAAAMHLVPAGALAELQESELVKNVIVAPPAGAAPFEPPPTPESKYYTWLPMGEGHRVLATLLIVSERVPELEELSRQGKKLAVGTNGGGFWFFDPENPEVFIKVLDGCAINGSWWVFGSGLTDLGTTVQVTDYATGSNYFHDSDDGEPFESFLDVEALPCD